MNFDLMRSLLIDRALRGELFSYSNSIAAEEKSLNEEKETPFTIPNNWQWKHVADCVQFNPKVIQDDAAEVSFIPMADVEPGFVDHCSTRQIKLWAKVKKGFSRFQEGDLLVAKITPCFQNRKSCIAKNLISGTGAGSTEFHVIRCVSDVDAKFLLYFFKSEYFIRYGVNHFNGTVGQQRVGAQDIKDCLIPVPPFDEQTRIVEKLEEAFDEIDRAEKAYDELQTLAGVLRGQILQEAIQGKLVPQLAEEGVVEQIGAAPEEVPFIIPETWKWGTLKNITGTITDGTHHSPKNSQVKDEVFKNLYVTAKNIKYTGVDLSKPTYVDDEVHAEIIQRCSPAFGDVLFVKDGATTGVVTVNNLQDSFSMLSSVALIKTLPEVLDSQYLVYVLRAPVIEKLIRSKMKGTGIPRVTLKILQDIPIPVPPFDEQLRIVGKVGDLLKQVKAFSV